MTYINYTAIKNYWDLIPQNTKSQAGRAALFSLIVGSVFSFNLKVGISSAALTALATGIYGAVTPLFLHLTQGRTQLDWNEEMLRTCTALVGTAVIAQAFGNSSVLQRISGIAICYGLLTYFNPQRGDLNHTNWVIA